MKYYKLTKIIDGTKGRLSSIKRIKEIHKPGPNTIWFHAASYGEYKQCQSVISHIKRERPDLRIILTFFSPSGYKHFDNNPDISEYYYLPTATRYNAKQFLDLITPQMAVLMVGDYWPAYLWELRKREIPVFAISARFKESSAPFHWYGLPIRRAIIHCITAILAQNKKSLILLQGMGYHSVKICGDPRLDNLFRIKSIPWEDPVIQSWSNGKAVFVAGSICHEGDFSVISSLVNKYPNHKFLIAPHETDDDTIRDFTSLLNVPFLLYTDACNNGGDSESPVLILNCIGVLSKAYRYGYAAYVGAGFHTDQPHSVIEPAVWGIPVFFGPHFNNNPHCVGLVEAGAARPIKNKNEMSEQYRQLEKTGSDMGKRALAYCQSLRGATEVITPILLEAIQ